VREDFAHGLAEAVTRVAETDGFSLPRNDAGTPSCAYFTQSAEGGNSFKATALLVFTEVENVKKYRRDTSA
jgi:hypothetical protein